MAGDAEFTTEFLSGHPRLCLNFTQNIVCFCSFLAGLASFGSRDNPKIVKFANAISPLASNEVDVNSEVGKVSAQTLNDVLNGVSMAKRMVLGGEEDAVNASQ